MDRSMQVSFDATFDELVDVTMRCMKQRGIYQAQRRNIVILVAIFGVIVILAAFSFSDLSWILKLSVALIGAIVLAVWSWFQFPSGYAKGIRSTAKRLTNGRDSFIVQVDIDAQGISFNQFENRTLHAWSTVQVIQSTAEGVQVQYKNGNLGMVRARAFESPEQQKEFVDLANSYLQVN